MLKRVLLLFLWLFLAMPALSQTSLDSVIVWSNAGGGNDMDVSADGIYYASVGDIGDLKVYLTSDGSLVKTFVAHDNAATGVSFSKDRNYIATVSNWENSIKIWKTTDWSLFKKIIMGQVSEGNKVSFSHDSRFIAATDKYNGYQIFDINTGLSIDTIPTDYGGLNNGPRPMSVEFSKNDSLLALSATFNSGRVYDIFNDSTLIRGKKESFFSTFSSDGKFFITDYETGSDFEQKGVLLYDIESKNIIADIPLSRGITGACMSPDNKYLVLAASSFFIYDIQNKKLYDKQHGSNYTKFIPNSNFLLVANTGGATKFNFDKLTGINEDHQTLKDKILSINPNPSNSKIIISYYLSQSMITKIIIQDINGNTVSKIYENITEKGTHDLSWDISNIANGVYFVKLELPNSFDLQKIIVNK